MPDASDIMLFRLLPAIGASPHPPRPGGAVLRSSSRPSWFRSANAGPACPSRPPHSAKARNPPLSNLPAGSPWPAALRRRPPPFYVAPLGRDAARSCHAFPPASPSGTLYLPSIFETQLSGHAQTFPLNPSTPSTNMCLCGTRFRGVARQRRGIIRRTRRQTTPRQPEPHGTLRGGHGDFGGVTPAGRGGRGQGT